MNRALYNEITTTHLFEMEEKAFMAHARMFLSHYRESASLADGEKEEDDSFFLSASTGFQEKLYLGDAGCINRWEELDDSDVVINVLRVSGPMMRNSICTFGSKELRRRIMEAADVKQCIGQIFIVDTPGGSSFTKFDLQEAMDYAHSKGQATAIYVDGMLASAGMAWGAMCQKRYARNEHCLFGCMGTFSSYYTNKDKDVNEITKEMFHVVYASQSPLKNKASRDSAEGDDTRMQEELDKSNQQYIEIIRKGIPNVTEEQLKGEIYEAGEVVGTLCSGICSFEDVVREMLNGSGFKLNAPEGRMYAAAAGGAYEGFAESAAKKNQEEPEGDEPEDEEPDDDEPGSPDEPGDPNNPVDPNEPDDEEPDDDTDKKSSLNKSNCIMSKKYEKIQQALEVESLESNKDNSLWLHEELADKLNEALDNKEKAEMALQSKAAEIKSLNEKIKQMNEQHDKEKKELEEKAEQNKEDVKQELQENADKKYNELKEEFEKVVSERDELKKQLEQKDEEIDELAKQPAPQNQPSLEADEKENSISALPHCYKTVAEQRAAKAELMKTIVALK